MTRPLSRSQQGSTVVEFALVATVFFSIIFGLINIGLIEASSSVGTNAAREGVRVGTINYECADGSCVKDHLNNSATSVAAISSAVTAKLGGLIKSAPTIQVTCLKSPALTAENCRYGTVTLDSDLIEVKVTWVQLGSSVFVKSSTHSATARGVITGLPDLSTSSSTATGLLGLAIMDGAATTTGTVQRIVATFSTVSSSCTSGFSFANTPASWNVTGTPVVDTVAKTITIPVTGATTTDLPNPAFAITFQPPTGCTAVGFTSQVPDDLAPPAATAVTWTNGGTIGKFEVTDKLNVTFSEAITNLPSNVQMTLQRSGSSNTTITILGTGTDTGKDIISSPLLLGDNYIKNGKGPITATGTVTQPSSKSLMVSFTSCTNCDDAQTGGPGSFTFVPSTSIADLAGNAAVSLTTPVPGISTAF